MELSIYSSISLSTLYTLNPNILYKSSLDIVVYYTYLVEFFIYLILYKARSLVERELIISEYSILYSCIYIDKVRNLSIYTNNINKLANYTNLSFITIIVVSLYNLIAIDIDDTIDLNTKAK